MAKPQKKQTKTKVFPPKSAGVRMPAAGVAAPKVADAPRAAVSADDVVSAEEAETLVRPGRRVTMESVAAMGERPLAAPRMEAPEVRWPRLEKQPGAGWWGKVKKTLAFWRKREGGLPEHLAAVKAGVLHELEALGVEKGVPLQGGPFRSVVLPTVRRKRRWGWPLVALVVLALLAVMVWVGRGPADPAKVLAQAMGAAVTKDVGTFEERVDVASVASSVVNQTFSAPQLDIAALPPELREQILHGSQTGDLAARMNAYIKPGLAENLRDEILQAVKEGRIAQTDGALLPKLWRDMGGKDLRIGAPRVMAGDAHMAMAEVPLHRADLALTLPLQVVLSHTADGWQVVDVPNMAAVLDGMSRAETAKARGATRSAAAPAALDGVQVSNLSKAKGTTVAGSLMVSMVVRNAGSTPLRDVQLKVDFGDAAGQPMKSAIVTLDGVLGAGRSREQTWAVPVDRSRAVERYVADLPLSALSVKVTVVGAR